MTSCRTTPDPAGSRDLASRYGLLPLYQDVMGFIGLAADGELSFVASCGGLGWLPPAEVAPPSRP